MSGGRVPLAAPLSFCAGVDRAIEIVEHTTRLAWPPKLRRSPAPSPPPMLEDGR